MQPEETGVPVVSAGARTMQPEETGVPCGPVVTENGNQEIEKWQQPLLNLEPAPEGAGESNMRREIEKWLLQHFNVTVDNPSKICENV